MAARSLQASQGSRVLRLVDVRCCRRFAVTLKVLRTKRIGYPMFYTKPLAQVNELAAPRTKRAVLPIEPGSLLLARRTFNWACRRHVLELSGEKRKAESGKRKAGPRRSG